MERLGPWLAVAAVPWTLALALWTLLQTLAGLFFALHRRLQGHELRLYRFGPYERITRRLERALPWEERRLA